MQSDVYVKGCEKCGTSVYGTMTSSFSESMTILYECSQCGMIWSEELDIGLKAQVYEPLQVMKDQD